MTVMYAVNADEDIGVLKLWIVFSEEINFPTKGDFGREAVQRRRKGGSTLPGFQKSIKKAAKASKIKGTRFSKKHQKSKFSRHPHHHYDSGTPVFLPWF